jgi:hypothetical protein
MTSYTLPDFTPSLTAARADDALRQALAACDRAHTCAVLWFAEVMRRDLYRPLGHASLQLYATQALGFTDNRYYLFKRLAADLDRLPVLREAVKTGQIGWTKARQVARVATAATHTAWVAKAATTGRRELERQVRQARKRRPVGLAAQLDLSAAAQPDLGAAAQLDFDAAAQPAFGAPAQPVADPPSTISLRADGVRLARFEALVEKAHSAPRADRRRQARPGAGRTRGCHCLRRGRTRPAGRAGHPDRRPAMSRLWARRGHDQPRREAACAGATGGAGLRRARAEAGQAGPRDHPAVRARRCARARSASLRDARMSVSAFSRGPSCDAARPGRFEPGGKPDHAVWPVSSVRA